MREVLSISFIGLGEITENEGLLLSVPWPQWVQWLSPHSFPVYFLKYLVYNNEVCPHNYSGTTNNNTTRSTKVARRVHTLQD
jgi:hypothetical protein